MQITARDLELARSCFRVLREHIMACQQHVQQGTRPQLSPRLPYVELVAQVGRQDFITRAVGHPLDGVSEMCRQNRFPDLAACAVNSATNEPGTRYQQHTPHWQQEIQRCLSEDWRDKGHPSALFDIKF